MRYPGIAKFWSGGEIIFDLLPVFVLGKLRERDIMKKGVHADEKNKSRLAFGKIKESKAVVTLLELAHRLASAIP